MQLHGNWILVLQEKRNLNFYEKLGYRREGEEHVINDMLTLVPPKTCISEDEFVTITA
jgi:hypothetical protein